MSAAVQRVLLLCGGVGGAKLARGFYLCAPQVDLNLVINVGDDFEHLGLSICPDIDTVLYTLAGIADTRRGWGLDNESWRTLDRLSALGGEDWFRLGDLDLATHLYRTAALRSGQRLSQVTRRLAERLGVRAGLFPATDDRLRTRLDTDRGVLDFQHYFVRERCAPLVRDIHYAHASAAQPSAALKARLAAGPVFDALVLAPSNPFLSLAPILAVSGMSALLRGAAARTLAVSPIIAGQAVKGPAAKLMRELGLTASSRAWAEYLDARYPAWIDEWVLDRRDRAEAQALAARGFKVRTTDTLMHSDAQKQSLARWLIEAGA